MKEVTKRNKREKKLGNKGCTGHLFG